MGTQWEHIGNRPKSKKSHPVILLLPPKHKRKKLSLPKPSHWLHEISKIWFITIFNLGKYPINWGEHISSIRGEI
jgi:hypothetical protein